MQLKLVHFLVSDENILSTIMVNEIISLHKNRHLKCENIKVSFSKITLKCYLSWWQKCYYFWSYIRPITKSLIFMNNHGCKPYRVHGANLKKTGVSSMRCWNAERGLVETYTVLPKDLFRSALKGVRSCPHQLSCVGAFWLMLLMPLGLPAHFPCVGDHGCWSLLCLHLSTVLQCTILCWYFTHLGFRHQNCILHGRRQWCSK